MTTNLYNKLNNYPYDNDNVMQSVRNYLINDVIPSQKKKLFVKRWKDFEYRNGNELYYKPLNLQVIFSKEDKLAKLNALYDINKEGTSQGITLFYKRVRDKYLNISREFVAEFLKSQMVSQITKYPKNVINKPIITEYPFQRLSIDLIDMNNFLQSNRGYRYILSCIDYFSCKIWLRPLKHKTSREVLNALKSIFDKVGMTCKILSRDNGLEFAGEVDEYCKEHDITTAKSQSYNPRGAQGKVERSNKEIRKVLGELFVRNHNTVWYNQLQTVEELRNSSYHSTIKSTPDKVWNNSFEENNEIVERLKKRAKRLVEKNKTFELNIGDHVRVKLSQLDSKIRKEIKQGNKKYLSVHYSPEIFVIANVLKPDREHYEKLRYTLNHLDGTPLLTQKKYNNVNAVRNEKRFFASDLQVIPKNTINDDISPLTVNKINKINSNEVGEEDNDDLNEIENSPPGEKVVRNKQQLPARVTRSQAKGKGVKLFVTIGGVAHDY